MIFCRNAEGNATQAAKKKRLPKTGRVWTAASRGESRAGAEDTADNACSPADTQTTHAAMPQNACSPHKSKVVDRGSWRRWQEAYNPR